MKQKLFLLQIFWIFYLISTCIQAQQSDVSLKHPVRKTRTKKSFSIKFQRPPPIGDDSQERYLTFPLQFGSENVTIPIGISTKTSAFWIHNNTYSEINGSPYDCSKSKTCLGQESLLVRQRGCVVETGIAVRERVHFGGGLTLDNFSAFIVDWQSGALLLRQGYSSNLGLGITRNNPTVPTIYETLKSEGSIDEQIVSISMKNYDEGELIFGDYPNNKTRAGLKFVELEGHDRSGFSVPVRRIYQTPRVIQQIEGDWAGFAILDMNYPFINLPYEEFDRIIERIDDQRLGVRDETDSPIRYSNGQYPVRCSAKNILKDLIIQFEGMTLNILASAYIVSAEGLSLDSGFLEHEKVPDEEKCALALSKEIEFVFGQPFFKCYDVVIDSERNSIAFSPKYIPDPAPFLSSSRIRTYILGMSGIAGLALFGFCLHSVSRRKLNAAKLNEEKRELDETPTSKEDVDGPVKTLQYPIEVGEGAQNSPSPYGYVNLQSNDDETIEQN